MPGLRSLSSSIVVYLSIFVSGYLWSSFFGELPTGPNAVKEFRRHSDAYRSDLTQLNEPPPPQGDHTQRDLAWIVIYHHCKKYEPETKKFMTSYRIFRNTQVYQKVLYIWDSSQGDSAEEYLLPYIPPEFADDFLIIDVATETHFKRQFSKGSIKNNCFNRGARYCEMLYMKTIIDLITAEAAKKYSLSVPEILAMTDGDTYWHSLPVRENFIDGRGRVIFFLNPDSGLHGEYSFVPGVQTLLKTELFSNGMTYFPVHVWFDTLSNMRNRIEQLHGFSAYFDIYENLTNPVCEYCVLGTYARMYERDRYRFPHSKLAGIRESVENAFSADSAVDAPMVYTVTHDKAMLKRADFLAKGCCVAYRLSAEETNQTCTFQPSDMLGPLTCYFPWEVKGCHTSPTLLSDHYELVWRTIEKGGVGLNPQSREECLNWIRSQ